jgi:hypothetical protein
MNKNFFSYVLFFVFALCFAGGTALGSVVINTPEGMPVEVDLLAVYRAREIVRVRFAASRSMLVFDSVSQDDLTRGVFQQFVVNQEEAKDKWRRAFSVQLEANRTPKDVKIGQAHFLNLDEFRRKSSDRLLRPGAYSLRLRASTTSPVDVPVEAFFYWYAQYQGRKTWEMEFHEKVALCLYDIPSDYLARPPPFPHAAYAGYAVIITWPQSGNILWESSNRESFLEDARKRFISKYVPKPPAAQFYFSPKKK